MHVRAAAYVGAALVGPVASANPAEVPPPTSAVSEPAAGDWYGWQIMVAEVGAIGLLAGGGALTSMSSSFMFLPNLGGVVYFGDGPLIPQFGGRPSP